MVFVVDEGLMHNWTHEAARSECVSGHRRCRGSRDDNCGGCCRVAICADSPRCCAVLFWCCGSLAVAGGLCDKLGGTAVMC